MTMYSLMPWRWGRRGLLSRREEEHPYYSLQKEMNKVFEDFFRDVEFPSLTFAEEGHAACSPRVDVTESDKDIRVTAELPGIEEKDIDVSLSADLLTIRGEKKEEKEENVKGYYRMERSYGTFARSIPLPCEVDAGRVEASFKGGILTVTLPKTAEVQKNVKTIPVKKA